MTTKANGSDIDVFAVSASGALSAPTVNDSATPVPFGFTFDPFGHLVVTEAGTSAVTTYALNPTGTVTELGSVTDGLAALCWVANDGNRFFFGSNAGSATVTSYTVGRQRRPSDGRLDGDRCGTDRPGGLGRRDVPLRGDRWQRPGRHLRRHARRGDWSRPATVAPELPGHSGLEGIAAG